MTDRTQPPEPDDRVVDDFFAAHRRAVRDLGADEETWQVVVERAGRGSRRSRGTWFVAGAVAASALAVAVLVGQGLGGPDALPAGPSEPGPVAATSTPEPETTDEPEESGVPGDDEPGATDEPEVTDAPGDVESPPAVALPVPAPGTVTVAVHEPTGEDGDLRTAVVQTECDAANYEWMCPALAVSEDAGETWTGRVDMFAAGYYEAVSSRERTWMWGPGPDGALGRPGVPEPSGELVRSDDGGRTWTLVPTRGDHPLAVEAFRSTLVVVTDGCEGGEPGTCAEVVITDVAADDATTGRRVVRLEDLPEQAQGAPGLLWAELSATYDAVYVTYMGTTWRIADGAEVATVVERPEEQCTLTTAPESPDGLLHWCADGEAVQVSSDGGSTWIDVPLPDGLVHGVASNDGARLAVATDGALWTGGEDQDWEEVLPWPGGATLLKALGGTSMSFGGPYRAYPEGAEKESQRWVTEDDWESWTELPPIEVSWGG